MAEISKDQREQIRSAIEEYRTAWLESANSPEFRAGVLSAVIGGEDSPAAWRAYEADKRIRNAEETLVRLLEAYMGVIDSVKYQGVCYSVRKGKRWNDRICSEYELVEQRDLTLDLDWPEGLRKPALPPGPETW